MRKSLTPVSVSVFIIVSIMMAGCSTTKTATSDKQSPASLVYKLNSPEGYNYRQTTITDQLMEVEGQSVPVSSKTVMTFSISDIDPGQEEISFKVILDSMNVTVASMMEDMANNPDVKGQSFMMSIKPNGKTGSLVGAEKIKIGAEIAGAGDLASSFAEIFPYFNRELVTPGETWPSTDTSNIKTAMMNSNSVTRSNNTFTGYVTVEGRKCAQIETTVEGKRDASINSQGMDMLMSMPFKGNEKILFDTEEGVIVRYEVAIAGSGFIEILSLGMDAGFSMNIKSILELK
ncbi:MAG: hypothetical protein R6W67_07945 [Bacteroidales bacterium]